MSANALDEIATRLNAIKDRKTTDHMLANEFSQLAVLAAEIPNDELASLFRGLTLRLRSSIPAPMRLALLARAAAVSKIIGHMNDVTNGKYRDPRIARGVLAVSAQLADEIGERDLAAKLDEWTKAIRVA